MAYQKADIPLRDANRSFLGFENSTSSWETEDQLINLLRGNDALFERLNTLVCTVAILEESAARESQLPDLSLQPVASAASTFAGQDTPPHLAVDPVPHGAGRKRKHTNSRIRRLAKGDQPAPPYSR